MYNNTTNSQYMLYFSERDDYTDSKIAVAQIRPAPNTFGTFIRPTYRME